MKNIKDPTIKDVMVAIEDLAISTAKGFSEVYAVMDKRFGSVDKQFESVNERFKSIDKRFDELHSEMYGEFYKLEKRVDIIEHKIDQLRTSTDEEVEVIYQDIADAKKRIARLEKKLKLKLAS